MSDASQRRDRALVERIKRKGTDGEAALAQLDRHYHWIWLRSARQRLGKQWADAPDVVQKIRLQIWNTAVTYNGKWEVSTWIRVMIRSRALDAIRARQRKREVSPNHDGAWFAAKSGGHLKVGDPAGGLSDTGEAANAAAMKLLKQQANGLSVKQLAWLYGVSEDAIHTRLRRARASIRGAAIEEGFDGRHNGICAPSRKRVLDEDDDSGRPFDVYRVRRQLERDS